MGWFNTLTTPVARNWLCYVCFTVVPIPYRKAHLAWHEQEKEMTMDRSVTGACASEGGRRMDVWAYNPATNEMVKIEPHPTPNPELDSEELARDHLVDAFPTVIYFFAEIDLMEVQNGT